MRAFTPNEYVAERTARHPAFPRLIEEAAERKLLIRSLVAAWKEERLEVVRWAYPQRSEEETRMDPVQVVQEFIDAFNARDVDRVVDCFSADAVMQNDLGAVFAQGQEAIRAHFGGFLPRSPHVHSAIRARIHVGPWVVQEEHVTGLVLGEPVPEFSIPSAYRVEDGKIVKCLGLQ